MQTKGVGIGSFFHETAASDLRPFKLEECISDYQLFYTGRHAIKHLLDTLVTTRPSATIWLPRYYCQHVTSWLQHCFSQISFYDIDPFSPEIVFDVEQFSNVHDIVILNNFWGLYTYTIPNNKNRPIFIEDHSHGWLSLECLNSKADFCFASLRKTLPVPLGGILWQPHKKQNIPSPALVKDENFYEHYALIEKAMALKKSYGLQPINPETKTAFLQWITKAEKYLHQQYDVISLKKEHAKIISSFLPKDYASYKKENFNYCKTHITETALFKIISPTTTSGFTFGLLLIFKERSTFEHLKSYLIEKAIYPSELWPDNQALKGWSYLLNIHIDFRYTAKHMKYISTCINTWINTQENTVPKYSNEFK
jgi:hypothetical protein